MKTPPFLHAFLLIALAMSCGISWAGAARDNIVSIEATFPVTEEGSPNTIPVPGQFVIKRVGNLEEGLPVWIDYSGTATEGADYLELPAQVRFEAGQNSISLAVQGIDDLEVEGDETVIARVFDATLGPLPLFEVDPEHARAVVTIKDTDRPFEPAVVSIKATKPIAEETAEPLRRANLVGEFTVSRKAPREFAQPVWVHVSGTATPDTDYEELPFGVTIPAGQESVTIPVSAIFDQVPEGIESVIATVSPCPPFGSLAPCYAFEVDPDCASATVFIREDGLSVASLLLLEPDEGTHFEVGEEIELTAIAVHIESFISEVQFWANGTKIGESVINFVQAPEPGTPIPHRFNWRNPWPPAGVYEVTARATIPAPRGTQTVISNPLRIVVGDRPPLDLPVVSIVATVPETTEPAPNIRVIPGQFTLTRTGKLSEELTVWLAYSGSATPRADYEPLPERVQFAPGQESIELSVRAVDDDEVEGDEHVVAQIYDPTDGPPRFEIDPNRGSAVVTIHDSDRPQEETVVSIEATRRIAEETAAPLRRMNLVGEFTVSRTGNLEEPQPVWIHLSGTAKLSPGRDYEGVPELVTIPANENSLRIPVTAIFDQIPEGIETVIATLDTCPPPDIDGACFNFEIDPDKASATVFIREDGLSVATVHITKPANGDQFPAGEPIAIEAVAIHLESYIDRVDFFAGDVKIGESQIVFVRAPDPGTPITHRFEWRDAPAGQHVLTARARILDPDPAGNNEQTITSSPVLIKVGGDFNLPPRLEIAAPPSGATFRAGEPIEIVAEGVDEDGFIEMVEFFANGLKIGEKKLITLIINPPVGAQQKFAFVWENAIPGTYEIVARATDSERATTDSDPIRIVVEPRDQRPSVNVVARDAFAVEPSANGTANPATFRIRRHGSTAGNLTVHYALGGTADNGTDYQTLSGTAVIPDGLASIDVTVVPLADQEREESETVILTLEEGDYNAEFPRRANAVIRDKPMPDPDRPRCIKLADGHIHLCFPGRNGVCIRVEASSNLREWSTLFCVIAVDGTVHVVQETPDGVPKRFFRISEEPNQSPDE